MRSTLKSGGGGKLPRRYGSGPSAHGARGIRQDGRRSQDRCRKGQNPGFNVEQINLQDDDALRRVGIGDGADILFALLDDDASNVFLLISARAIAPNLPIVSISGVRDTIVRLYAAGATKDRPYRISGYKIYEHMHRLLIAETLGCTVFGRVDLDIAEIHVTEKSFLHGKYLDELSLSDRYNLIVLGVVDREYGDNLIFATDPKRHKLDGGDVLVVIGPEDAFAQFQHDIETEENFPGDAHS